MASNLSRITSVCYIRVIWYWRYGRIPFVLAVKWDPFCGCAGPSFGYQWLGRTPFQGTSEWVTHCFWVVAVAGICFGYQQLSKTPFWVGQDLFWDTGGWARPCFGVLALGQSPFWDTNGCTGAGFGVLAVGQVPSTGKLAIGPFWSTCVWVGPILRLRGTNFDVEAPRCPHLCPCVWNHILSVRSYGERSFSQQQFSALASLKMDFQA